MIRKRGLWAILALLIGTTGAGCRESNPAYLRIDAAKDTPATVSADSAGPEDKVSVDAAPADRAPPDLVDRDAVMTVADVPPDERVEPADALVDGTGGADSLGDAGDAAEKRADALSDTPPRPGDGEVVGLDANLDRRVDEGLKPDVNSNLDAGLHPDANPNLDADGDLGVGGDAGEASASETGANL